MRVIHILAPAPVGGAEQVVQDLTGSLAKTGAEVHIAAVLDSGKVDHPFLHQIPSSVNPHPTFVPHKAYFQEWRKLKTLIGNLKPDVVHTHGYRSNVVGSAAARALEVPTVSTIHGFTGTGWKIRLFQWLERQSLIRADAVVAVSRPLAHQLEKLGIARNTIHTIPNARDLSMDLLDAIEAREKLDVRPEAFHIGWVGRMTEEKAPDLMVEAAVLLRARKQLSNFRLTLIGDGPYQQPLKDRTKKRGLQEFVKWTGQITNAARFYNGFDVIAISSRSEGTPIVALEAMAAGTPLVATKVGGIPDLLDSNSALLIPPGDPSALAAAIEKINADPSSAETRVEAARKRIESTASPERWAEQHLEVYHHVLKTKKQ